MFIKVSMVRRSCLVTFLLQGKVLCFARVGFARCLSIKAFWIPWPKNYTSGYIWHKSFIQTVKCSFFNQIIVYQLKFLWRAAHVELFFTSRNLLSACRQVTWEMFISNPKTTLTKSVVFHAPSHGYKYEFMCKGSDCSQVLIKELFESEVNDQSMVPCVHNLWIKS